MARSPVGTTAAAASSTSLRSNSPAATSATTRNPMLNTEMTLSVERYCSLVKPRLAR